VLEGVKEAADEAFPPDMVSMTFRLALGNVQVDAFQLKDKAIKFKVASQLYYHLTQYVEGKKGKKNIAQKDYGSLALDVTDIIVNRVPQDYRDNWPVAIHDATEEVGQLVFKGEWGQVNPFLKVV
jgi:hypothetical protein